MPNIKAYKNQNYKLLDEKCSSTQLFIDPEFSACLHSISHTGKLNLTNENGDNILKYIEWRRPHEIIDHPRFVIDGFQRQDIGQGQLGNCWFVAAAGALTLNSELMTHVIPYNQTFDASEYTGIFHFRFWLFGEWNDVVIDDRLPCYKGNFVFCQNNKDPNELWAPLLEKAYAKVCGSYEVMAGGQITDGLIDFTGGIDESIMLNIPSAPPDFKEEIKRVLYQACARKSMVGCAIISNNDGDALFLETGLVSGHAFSVTQMKELTTPKGVVTLIRCLNPWNNSAEWNGAWSDNSPLWDIVTAEEKRKFKFQKIHDGEFWMSYDDFFDHFDEIQICHCRPESLGLLEITPPTTNLSQEDRLTWHEEVFHGKWELETSAGGSGLLQQSPEKYWTNPQYLIKLEFADGGIEEKWCTMIIALMFKEERQRILNGEDPAYIAFDVYKVKNDAVTSTNIKECQKLYMTHLEEVGNSGEYTPSRSVSKRFKVRPGSYVIVPNTLKYNESGEFFLRIFTEKEANQTVAKELTINKENLTELEINRPQATARCQDDREVNDNKDDNTVDSKVDSEPVSTSETSNEQPNDATDIGGAFPGSNITKPTTDTVPENKEGYCTIQ